MKRIPIQTNTLISRVVIEQQDDKKVATGVELAMARSLTSNVRLSWSAGALHTPPVLLLSGIGPKGDLARHDIPQKVDSPKISHNLFNLMNVKQFRNLRNAEIGAAVGSAKWDDFGYKGANAQGFIVCQSIARTGLEPALAADEDGVRDDHPFLNGSRCHVETFIQYAANNKESPVPRPRRNARSMGRADRAANFARICEAQIMEPGRYTAY